MAKYVDTDTIVEKLWPVDPENDGSDGCTVVLQNLTFTSADLESLLDEIPAADVVPVVHAKWIDLPKYKSVGGTFQKAQICSACKAFYVSDANTPFSNHRYCADCGAIMDLKDKQT